MADHIGVATGRLLEDRVREAAGWLRIRRYEPGMVLELRLAAARSAALKRQTIPDVGPPHGALGPQVLPRCSSMTIVVSAGSDEIVTFSRGTDCG